jgi:short-subunit dehydrogenase
MRARRRGQIALMGSVGARVGIAASPAYSASKAALETYGLALRSALARTGVKVSVISPGFVASPMSDRVEGRRLFLMRAEEAARRIERGLAANKARIAFPLPLAIAASVLSFLPYDLADRLVKPFAFRVRD